MGSASAAPDPASRWDIATPSTGRLAGVAMAGFRERFAGPLDLAVVPYPAVTVVVDLGSAEELSVVDDRGRREYGAVVAGLVPSGLRGIGRDVECLQIRLSPLVAHSVLDAGVHLGGEVVALDALWGREAELIRERIRAAPTWTERFACAEGALGHRLRTGRAVDPEVAATWRRLVAERGRVRVDELADEVGWSRKRLWSRFSTQVGLSPKRAARLVRFDRAVHRLAAGQRPADVAAMTGFADQSHLHREVVAFTGTTPVAVAAAPWLAVDSDAWGRGDGEGEEPPRGR